MENKELFQLISIFLQYPSEEVIDISDEDLEKMSNCEAADKLSAFIEYLNSHSLDELREKYVQTFDFNDKTNLYLTYSKLKEERERGQILVSLKRIYEDEGYYIESSELPDYLPLFLEFISIANEQVAKQLLSQFKGSIEILRDELIKIKSPYGELVEMLLIISNKLLDQ